MTNNTPTLIYDADCRLCQQAVKFLKTKNGDSAFGFIAANSSTCEQLMNSHNLPMGITNNSVILIENHKVYSKSTAVIRALQKRGGVGHFAVVFMIIPAFLRNLVYDLVANMRKKF